jgi:hypothetical protein
VQRRHERIARAQIGETIEVAVAGPQLFDTVPDADRRDARVVQGAAAQRRAPGQGLEQREMRVALGERAAARMRCSNRPH